ncbi:hypothetical protein JW916_04380 [Candidatus Sumerlaeota bacterium]|nr:hypothetical protein [Candidatus Sumerlaeota bacterium]
MNSYWWQPFSRDVFAWWAALVLVGWLVFPLVHRSFFFLPDRGLLLAKLIGIVLLGFGRAWLTVASRWFPFLEGREGVATLDILIALNIVLALLHFDTLVGFLRTNLGRLVRIEASFLALFLLYLWFRSYVPDATFDALGWFGAEKWGNLAILTSIWRNPSIPPVDPWLAGYSLNYYYFSHWIWATLAHLARVAPPVAFNLALATLFALLIQAAFAAGHALSERASGGWWGVFLVALAGTPATWLQAPEFIRAWSTGGIGAALHGFDFWSPSDVLPHTRNEFPAFNWLLGDLHAHSLGLLLLLAAICLAAHLQRVRENAAVGWAPAVWGEILAAGLLLVLLASMWATNSWDFAVAALVGLIWVVAESCRDAGLLARAGDGAKLVRQSLQGVLVWLLALLLALGIPSGFYTAYARLPLDTIHNATLARLPGILGALGSVGLVVEQTTPLQWFGFWGFFALAFALIFVRGAAPKGRHDSPRVAALAVGAAILALTYHSTHDLAAVGFTLIWFLVAAIATVIVDISRWRLETSSLWAFVLLAAALVCQIVPEFFYLDDPIGAPNERYNTVFKLYYPAWALMGLALAILLATYLRRRDEHKRLAVPVFLMALLVLVSGLYPVLGVAGRLARGRAREAQWIDRGLDPDRARRDCRTLDALAFMDLPSYAPDDLRLGLWMRENLAPERADRIAEAPGESYSMTARLAVVSGIPSFLGWIGHEAQWRGAAFNDPYIERFHALEILYSTRDPGRALEICRANGLRWVAVGELERERYAADALAKFDGLGRVAARFGDSTLYEIPVQTDTLKE